MRKHSIRTLFHSQALELYCAPLFSIAFFPYAHGTDNTQLSMPLSALNLSISSHRAEFAKPALLLAKHYDRNVNLKDYWASEKLDGIRCYWDGQQLWTRGGLKIPAPKRFTAGFPQEPLDGELWIGRQQFEAISALVRRKHSSTSDWGKVKFYVFDLPNQPIAFNKRLELLEHIVQTRNFPTLKMVPHFKVQTHSALMHTMNKVTKDGGEGLMLHKGASLYRGYRSDDLLKVKPYFDDEAIVVKHFAGKGKHMGRLGALLVKNSEDILFKVGTGFSDAERENPPPIGSYITYRYLGKTKAGKPRFASFMRMKQPE